jgi:hypothetical protein
MHALQSSESGAGPREVPFLATYRKELVGFPEVLNMHGSSRAMHTRCVVG